MVRRDLIKGGYEWVGASLSECRLEPAAQRMGQRQKDFGLQVLMAKA